MSILCKVGLGLVCLLKCLSYIRISYFCSNMSFLNLNQTYILYYFKQNGLYNKMVKEVKKFETQVLILIRIEFNEFLFTISC